MPPMMFEGVRVLSLAEQYPGPYATLLLADLGADVVLIERPGGGDPARIFPPFFRSLARNKRSACLDLKTEEGRSQLRELAADADVLLEGFRPGTMDRLGVGYAALAAINPRLVYASISGFGQTGPYRDRTAHDLSYQAVTGHLFAQARGSLPVTPAVAYGDLSSAMFAAFAIASALFARERSGRGTSIDVSMTDGLVSWMTAYLGPVMNGHSSFEFLDEPAYGAFDCADGRRLTLSIAHEDHFWRALCAILELADIAPMRGPQRLAAASTLRARIADALLAKDLAHWATMFDAHAIPWSPLNDLAQVAGDPHFASRGLFATVVDADGASEHHVVQPVRFSAWSTRVDRPAPRLGEHTEHVLAEARERSSRR